MAAFVVALGFDATLRWLLWYDKGGCRFVRISSPSDAQPRLILFLPGLIANARSMPRLIEEEWAKHGYVWAAEYSTPRFNPRRIVNDVVEFIVSYCEERGHNVQDVVLIGSSLGGLLAYDVQERLFLLKPLEYKVSLVVIDSPVGAVSLRWPLSIFAQVVRVLPFGPILNHASPLVAKLLAPTPSENRLGEKVDEGELNRSIENARKYPLSFYRDQLLYIVRHHQLGIYSLWSLRRELFYIRSQGDTLLNYRAMGSWGDTLGEDDLFRIAPVDADHAAYQLQPLRYRRAFEEAFQYLFESSNTANT